MTRHHLLQFLRFAALAAMVPMQSGCAVMLMIGGNRGASASASHGEMAPAAANAVPGAEGPQSTAANNPVAQPGPQAATPGAGGEGAIRASAASASPSGRGASGAGPSGGVPAGSAGGASRPATLPNLASRPNAPAPAPPPNINAPGAAGSTPPTARLPPPVNTSDRCVALCKKFGIRSISGSNATPDELDKLERVFSQLPAGLYMNLAVDYEPTSAKADERAQPRVAAYWTLAREDGSKLPDRFLAPESKGGRMYLFRTNSTEWTICHETCHHISMQADKAFGARLAEDLGYSRHDNERDIDDVLDIQKWDRNPGADMTTAPTDYALTKWKEHIAELMTAYIRGTERANPRDSQIRPDFAGPGAARVTLAARLGPGKI